MPSSTIVHLWRSRAPESLGGEFDLKQDPGDCVVHLS